MLGMGIVVFGRRMVKPYFRHSFSLPDDTGSRITRLAH